MSEVEAFVCCGGGLYYFRDGAIQLIRRGIYYGLTRHKGLYYLFERLNRQQGQLWRFKWDGAQIADMKVIYRRLSGGVHQIDFIDDRLYVIDSYRNVVLVLGPHGWLKRRYYPRGKLANGRESPNYMHFNSIFATSDRIYLLAHNETQKTGKLGEILVFDRRSMREIDLISGRGRCAHNILIHDGLFLSCDSLSGTLTNHGQPVLDLKQYTRGLALNDDLLLVGGSLYSERGERLSHNSYVHVVNRHFKLLDTVEIVGGGQTHEIRLIGTDYGLSNTASAHG